MWQEVNTDSPAPWSRSTSFGSECAGRDTEHQMTRSGVRPQESDKDPDIDGTGLDEGDEPNIASTVAMVDFSWASREEVEEGFIEEVLVMGRP